MKLSRRELMGGFGGLLLSSTLTGISGDAFATKKEEIPKLPWPYKKVDPKLAAQAGYEGYIKGACCYGAFSAIADDLAKNVGAPYTLIPMELWIVGEGGIAGTASLCGAINGAAFVIFLTAGGMEKEKREKAFAVINDLYHWYEQAALPIYKPQKAKIYEGEIKQSKSGSTLCHGSLTNWCKASGHKAFSKARSERCARLTADVAFHTAELLNNYSEGAFKSAYKLSAEAQGCVKCHEKGSPLENTRGLQECKSCHSTLGPAHPKTGEK